MSYKIDVLGDYTWEGAVEYHYGQFPPSKLAFDRLLDPLAKASASLARYSQVIATLHNSEMFLAPLRYQEAVVSSRLEGTISTLDEVLQYEAEASVEEDNIDNRVGARTEAIEVALFSRALKYAQQEVKNGKEIRNWLVRATHKKLLSFGRGEDKSPGEFKNEQNYIVDKIRKKVLFIPINPEQLSSGLDRLYNYMSDMRVNALIRTAISHLEFEALHPFKDGNGRIGRMLVTLQLWQEGLIAEPHFYMSEYLEREKDTYIDTMREVSMNGDWTAWCEFFFEALTFQAERNTNQAEAITKLYNEMKDEFREVLNSKWHIHALDYIFTNPIFNTTKFAKGSGIPEASARRFAKLLVDSGKIQIAWHGAGQRPTYYSFNRLMDLIRS